MYCQDLTSKASSSIVRYCLSTLRASSHCEDDMGALLWLNVVTLERAPERVGLAGVCPWPLPYSAIVSADEPK